MAPQTATTDEDLLIISDDTANTDAAVDDTNIEISLDEPTVVEETKTEEVINFDAPVEATSEISEEAVEVSTPQVVEEDTSGSVQPESATPIATEEIGLDLSTPEETVEEVVSEKVDEKEEVSDFSLDISDEIQEEKSTTDEVPDEDILDTSEIGLATDDTSVTTAGMNSILSETIAKLEARQDAIATEKDGKSTQVSDLKEQIKKLEEEVALHEGEIEELTAESKKIATNVKSLEKMKLDEEVTKEHNSKRVPKK